MHVVGGEVVWRIVSEVVEMGVARGDVCNFVETTEPAVAAEKAAAVACCMLCYGNK